MFVQGSIENQFCCLQLHYIACLIGYNSGWLGTPSTPSGSVPDLNDST